MLSTTTMATKTFKVAHLLVLLVIIPATIPFDLPYKTLAEKSVAGFKPIDVTSFSIPENQCSGFVGESLLCGVDGVVGSVKVVVQEASSFASVHINRLLHNVTILRGRDVWGECAGQADVDVHVGCLISRHQARRRRDVHALPPAIYSKFLV